jgi:hypothetical protein
MKDTALGCCDLIWSGGKDDISPLLQWQAESKIIMLTGDSFAEFGGKLEDSAIVNLYALAFLTNHNYMIWGRNPALMKRILDMDSFPVFTQARIGQILERVADEIQFRPFLHWRYGANNHYALQGKARQEAHFCKEGALLAGITNRGEWMERNNVWVGLDYQGNTGDAQAELMRFIGVPAGVRWLKVGRPAAYFAPFAWRKELTCMQVPTVFGSDADILDGELQMVRKLHWIIYYGADKAEAAYYQEQCVETGTPMFATAGRHLPAELCYQQFPPHAGREPLLTPEIRSNEARNRK